MNRSKETKHLSEKAQKDYELVVKATKFNDQQAFSDLMDRYKDSIYFMLLKMVKIKMTLKILPLRLLEKHLIL